MFKIGDFSKICCVSMKALRHWDELGLLKPTHVDRESGYRYYTIEQVYEVNRILALKTMGLSLAEIRTLLRETITPDEIRGMFKMRKAEIQQELEDARLRLQMLESRLRQLDQDVVLPEYEVNVRSVPAQEVITLRDHFATVNLFADVLLDVHDDLKRRPDWTFLAVFHDGSYENENLDVEIGFIMRSDPVEVLAIDTERAMTELPAVERMASTIHRGSWTTLSEGYNVLGRWIHDNGYHIAGPGREIFHTIGRTVDSGSYVTELQFPVEGL